MQNHYKHTYKILFKNLLIYMQKYTHSTFCASSTLHNICNRVYRLYLLTTDRERDNTFYIVPEVFENIILEIV